VVGDGAAGRGVGVRGEVVGMMRHFLAGFSSTWEEGKSKVKSSHRVKKIECSTFYLHKACLVCSEGCGNTVH
jgi:hypothetical protein